MYEYSLKFKSTQLNENADALSRLLLPSVPRGILIPSEIILLLKETAAWMEKDSILSKVLYFVENSWPKSINNMRVPTILQFKTYVFKSNSQSCILEVQPVSFII